MSKPTPLKFPKVGSVEVGDPAKPGESRARRSFFTVNDLVTHPVDGISTVPDILDYAAREHGTRDALGWRDILDVHEEDTEIKKNVGGKEVTEKKTWKYFELSPYKYLSFVQVKEAVSELAKGLIALGITKEDVFNVYAATSVNWQLMAHACATISTRIATAYDTLGEAGLKHSINEPSCVGIFTNADLLPTLARVIDDTPSIHLIIYDGEPHSDLLDEIQRKREGIRVLTPDEVRTLGKDTPIPADRAPTKDDVSCIMYTSGTTGPPKGVVITHANLVASVGSVYRLLGHHLQQGDKFLAYLPLAHILEYIVELSLFFAGMTSGYGRIKTLTDQSVRNCQGDLKELKPAVMIGVPAVWETIRKGIVGKVNKMSGFKQGVFNSAMSIKKAEIPVLSGLVDSTVLSAVKAQTGGNLRFGFSGGAAISKETQEFLSLALVTIIQGYGMTETCGMCAILPPEYMQYGSVGIPVPSVEVKLIDVPSASYNAQGNPPQGEVLLRGPSVIKGYFKRDDLNNDREIFTEDGWFRTGDVGQWNADGTLSIIDRIKNLVKLQGGEYIALERLESAYKSCNLVSNICVYADVDARQPIAIIIPHEANLRHAIESWSDGPSPDASFHDLCEDKKVKELVLKEANAVGKKNGFKSIEVLQAVVLTSEEWTPENGRVTAAQKLQRRKIAEDFKDEIKAAYA